MYNKPQILDNDCQHTIKSCEMRVIFNPLPNEKIMNWTNLKALADDKINVTEKLKFLLN